MSYSKFTNSLYSSPRSAQNQLLNSIFNNHDLCCGCNEPASHLTFLLINNCNPQKFSPEEKEVIKKWHGDITTQGGDTTEDIGIDAGELETLFAEDDTTEDG